MDKLNKQRDKLKTVAGPWFRRGLADVTSIRLCNLFFSPPGFITELQYGGGGEGWWHLARYG